MIIIRTSLWLNRTSRHASWLTCCMCHLSDGRHKRSMLASTKEQAQTCRWASCYAWQCSTANHANCHWTELSTASPTNCHWTVLSTASLTHWHLTVLSTASPTHCHWHLTVLSTASPTHWHQTVLSTASPTHCHWHLTMLSTASPTHWHLTPDSAFYSQSHYLTPDNAFTASPTHCHWHLTVLSTASPSHWHPDSAFYSQSHYLTPDNAFIASPTIWHLSVLSTASPTIWHLTVISMANPTIWHWQWFLQPIPLTDTDVSQNLNGKYNQQGTLTWNPCFLVFILISSTCCRRVDLFWQNLFWESSCRQSSWSEVFVLIFSASWTQHVLKRLVLFLGRCFEFFNT